MKVNRPNEIRCALTIVPQLNREDRFNPDEMAFGFHWAGGVKIS